MVLGEGNSDPLQYCAWKIPWTAEPGRVQSMGSLRVGYNWVTSLSLFTFMYWRRKWQTHSSVLSLRIPGIGEPGGLPSMELHRVGHNWSDLAAAAAALKHKTRRIPACSSHTLTTTSYQPALREASSSWNHRRMAFHFLRLWCPQLHLCLRKGWGDFHPHP